MIVLGVLTLKSQTNYYYYYGDQKIALKLNQESINIIASENFKESTVSNSGNKSFKSVSVLSESGFKETKKIIKIEFVSKMSNADYLEMVNEYKKMPGIYNVAPYFERGNESTPISISNNFYVKLKNAKDLHILETMAKKNDVMIVGEIPYMPNWYILSTKSPKFGTSLELSNQFYETGNFEYVDPAFMFNFDTNCSDDPLFGSLWGLKNNTNSNYDINICEVWNITQGANVNVAVLDHGIEKTHGDLSANIHALSYNCYTGTTPSGNVNYHGTHVAGTIAAVKDNNLKVAGVAQVLN